MSGPVGILALQGDFESHSRLLQRADVRTREVRSPIDLDGLSALLLPGGESTTISKGLDREGLRVPIRQLAAEGKPVFGTCAGLVLMGREHLNLIDMEVQRNAFGRQIHSFETDLSLPGAIDPPVRALFIRAPIVEEIGPEVEVLGRVDDRIVAVRQRNCTAISFHPELVGDARVHLAALGLSERGVALPNVAPTSG